MYFVGESSSYRKEVPHALDSMPLLSRPCLNAKKVPIVQPNTSTEISTAAFSPITSLVIPPIRDSVVEAENAEISQPLNDFEVTLPLESPATVQDTNLEVMVAKKSGPPSGPPQINDHALSLLQYRLRAAKDMCKLCCTLALEMKWSRDFKPFLGPFEKWIMEQRHIMFKCHQDSFGRRFVSYCPVESFPYVDDSCTKKPRKSKSTHEFSIEKLKLKTAIDIADSLANAHAQSDRLDPSAKEANTDISFPMADNILTLPQLLPAPSVTQNTHSSEAKLPTVVQSKKRGPTKGVKRGPYKKMKVSYPLEINNSALSLLSQLFGPSEGTDIPLCKLSCLLASEMNWKTKFKEILGSFEKWITDQSQTSRFQFHKVPAGKSYVSYNPWEIFPYAKDSDAIPKKRESHEAVVGEHGCTLASVAKNCKNDTTDTTITAGGLNFTSLYNMPIDSAGPVHLTAVESYPVYNLHARVSPCKSSLIAQCISTDEISSDEDNSVDCQSSSVNVCHPDTNFHQPIIEGNHSSSVDEMKCEADDNVVDYNLGIPHAVNVESTPNEIQLVASPLGSRRRKEEVAEGQSDQDSFIWTNNRSDDEGDEEDEADGECNYFETTPTESPTTVASPPIPNSITDGVLSRPDGQAVETSNTPADAEILITNNIVNCDQNDCSTGEDYVFENDIDLSRSSDESTGNGEFVPYFDDVDSLEDKDSRPENLPRVAGVVESVEARNMTMQNTSDATAGYVDDNDFMWTGDEEFGSPKNPNRDDAVHQATGTKVLDTSRPQLAALVLPRHDRVIEHPPPDDTEYVFEDFQENDDHAVSLSLSTGQAILPQDDAIKKNGRSAVEAAKKFKYPYLKSRGSTILIDDDVQTQKRHGNYTAIKSKILTAMPKQQKRVTSLDTSAATQSISVGGSAQHSSSVSIGQSKSVPLAAATRQAAEIEQGNTHNVMDVNVETSEEVGMAETVGDNNEIHPQETMEFGMHHIAEAAAPAPFPQMISFSGVPLSNTGELTVGDSVKRDDLDGRLLANEKNSEPAVIDSDSLHNATTSKGPNMIENVQLTATAVPSFGGYDESKVLKVRGVVSADNDILRQSLKTTKSFLSISTQQDNLRKDVVDEGHSGKHLKPRQVMQEGQRENNDRIDSVAVGLILEADTENVDSQCTACGNTGHILKDCRFLEFEHANVNNDPSTSFLKSKMGEIYFQKTGMKSLSWLIIHVDKNEYSGSKEQKSSPRDKEKSSKSKGSPPKPTINESIQSSLPTSRDRVFSRKKAFETSQSDGMLLDDDHCTACGKHNHSYATCYFVEEKHPNVNLDRTQLFGNSSMGRYYIEETKKTSLSRTTQLLLCTGCGRGNHSFRNCMYTREPSPHPNVNFDEKMIFKDSLMGKAYIEKSGEKYLVKSFKYYDLGSPRTQTSSNTDVTRHSDLDSTTSPRDKEYNKELSSSSDSGKEMKRCNILRNFVPCTACGKFNHSFEKCTFVSDKHVNVNLDRTILFAQSSMGRYYVETTQKESLSRHTTLLLCTACGRENHVFSECVYLSQPCHPNVNWDNTMIFKDSPMGKAYIERSGEKFLVNSFKYFELGSEIRKQKVEQQFRERSSNGDDSQSGSESHKITEDVAPVLESDGKRRGNFKAMESTDIAAGKGTDLVAIRDDSARGDRGSSCTACGMNDHSYNTCGFIVKEHPNVNLDCTVPFSQSSMGKYYKWKTGDSSLGWAKKCISCTACGKDAHLRSECPFLAHCNVNNDRKVLFKDSIMGKAYMKRSGKMYLVESAQYEGLIDGLEKQSKKRSHPTLLNSVERLLAADEIRIGDSNSCSKGKKARHNHVDTAASSVPLDITIAKDACAHKLLVTVTGVTTIDSITAKQTEEEAAGGGRGENSPLLDSSNCSDTKHSREDSDSGNGALTATLEPELNPTTHSQHLSLAEIQSVQVTQDIMRSLLRNKKIFDSVASFGLLRVFRGAKEVICRTASEIYDNSISKDKDNLKAMTISVRSCYSTPLEVSQEEDGEVKEEGIMNISLDEISNDPFTVESHERWVRQATLADQATYCPSRLRKIVRLLCKYSPTHSPSKDS